MLFYKCIDTPQLQIVGGE